MTSKEIAKIVMKEFNDISLEDMTKIIDRYKKIDAWYKDSNIPEKDLIKLRTMFDNGCTFWHTSEYYLDYSQTNSIL